jgi:ATP-dependent 26S proteasome regulatory subunit
VLLEAIDGLAGDADVAFLLTTNRPDLLEPALAARPGRVDLAVEIPLPDLAGRTELLRLYARDLPLSAAAIDHAARRTDGATASFAKELMRRTTLAAAERGGGPGDADLATALDDMMADREALTRALFGVGGREALRRERRLRAGFRAEGRFDELDEGDDPDGDDGA